MNDFEAMPIGAKERIKELESQLADEREKVAKLEKAIAYTRQIYHLPKMVHDLFGKVVPCRDHDGFIDDSFYNEVMGEIGE
jgi:predicted RNase H-like nuclease (RuvC/YqgF family)